MLPPHEVERRLVAITDGLLREIRYRDADGKVNCLHPESVLSHTTLKLGLIVQCLKKMIRVFDSKMKFNGEAISDLVILHDIGESHPHFGDIPEPQKTEEDEKLERELFLKMIDFFPVPVIYQMASIYDLQKCGSVDTHIFRAAELVQRLYYCIREIHEGNREIFLPRFWDTWEKLRPFIAEFNGLRIMLSPVQEFVDLMRAKTPSEP